MQGTVILRSLAVLSLAGSLAACHFNTRTTAGETPQPSKTTLAQANSTAAPDQWFSGKPGQKYFARTGPHLKDVTFEVWANGNPIGTISWPSKALDITHGMRGHANVVVIRWTRTSKTGTGMMRIETAGNKSVLVGERYGIIARKGTSFANDHRAAGSGRTAVPGG